MGKGQAKQAPQDNKETAHDRKVRKMYEAFLNDYFEGKVYGVEFSFKVDKEEIKFDIVTNMPQVHGMDINGAFVNWVHRTDDYGFDCFVAYIYSKQPDAMFTVILKSEFDDLLQAMIDAENDN